jgi:hypothetical protein
MEYKIGDLVYWKGDDIEDVGVVVEIRKGGACRVKWAKVGRLEWLADFIPMRGEFGKLKLPSEKE